MNTIIIEKKFKNDNIMQGELDGFHYVLKARVKAKEQHREALKGVYIDDGLVICTDGHRLHMYLTDLEIENGLYEVITQKVNQIILKKVENDMQYVFPDYNNVIPTPHWNTTISCNGSHHTLFHVVYKEYANEVRSFNTDYLHDAYMNDSEVSLSYDTDKTWSPLVIYDNKRRAALVMPMKTKQG